MQVVYERCCGLDVHKKTVVACLIIPDAAGRPHKEIRTFRTMTADLLCLADWLAAAGCTHVVMESTGVYWKPIFNLLEGQFTVLVANAQHIKHVPGRKTDVRDAEWLADLLRHGLVQGSFIPSATQQSLACDPPDVHAYAGSIIRCLASSLSERTRQPPIWTLRRPA